MTTVGPARRLWGTTWSWAVRAVRLEVHIYTSIGRAIARRPAVPAGGSGFRYHSPVLTVLIVFIVLSALEIPVIDLIVHRWPAVRIAFLVLGIWGVTWMLGLLCSYLMRPHTVGPDGVRVRNGLELDVPLSWDDIRSVAIRHRSDEGGAPRITDEDGSRTLHARIANETNILIELEGPTEVTLPGRGPTGGRQRITAARLWADDPRAYLAEVGRHI